MDILSHYLQKHSLFEPFIAEPPSENMGCCVVIPCYNEESIFPVINSLFLAEKPSFDIEIIIVLNGKENDTEEVKIRNQQIRNQFVELKHQFSSASLKLHLIEVLDIPKKVAGVGFARKVGMDEAVRRFLYHNRNDGILVSLDVDCTVDKSYFVEIEKIFREKRVNACSIRFEHSLDVPVDIRLAIAQYELYLHYHLLALRYAGHPYAFHTIGSCFAVRADIYAKQGGMNQRQAGEDFYFLQKVIPLGKYYQLNTTCVYPSARISNRVPFGTGATIRKIIAEPELSYTVYDFKAYQDIKCWFSNVFRWYQSSNRDELLKNIPEILQQYLNSVDYINRLAEIKSNTAGFSAFQKRFFRWFNLFMVIKYLNFAHEHHYKKIPVERAINQLLRAMNIEYSEMDKLDLLFYIRRLTYSETI